MGTDGGRTDTLQAFRDATMELDNVYSMFAKACGLSDAEYWSLVLIHEGVETQAQISGQLYLSRQTLNSAFKQLVRKGLVRLEPYEDNQRAKRASLPEAGRRFVSMHVIRMHEIEEQAWQRMPPEERTALTALTRKYTGLVRELLDSAQQAATE